MTSRQRLLTTLAHQEPDRVPLDLGGHVTTIQRLAYEGLKDYLGINKATKTFIREHADLDNEVLEEFAIDTRYVRLKPPKSWKLKLEPDNSYLDEWGVRWKKMGLYHEPVAYPLAHAKTKDLERYNWPDPSDEGRVEGLREQAKQLCEETDYAVIAQFPMAGGFELAWTCLRGPQFLEDLILNRKFAETLLSKICDLEIEILDRFLNAVGPYVQVVAVGDDVGQQRGPLISPNLYRDVVKPFQKRLWGFIKQKSKAHLFVHSDGSVYQFIPDFIELGVSILNPVQVRAKDMDTRRLKEEFGHRISFWGGIDTQEVLPFGTPEEVEKEVRKRIRDLAPGGGYVLSPIHNIQAGVSAENIVKMYEGARKYGVYPIRDW